MWVAAQGPNHDLVVTKRVASSGKWESVTASGNETVYSAPAGALDSGGNYWIAYEGPKNALWEALDWANGSGAGVNRQGPTGTTYSAPSEMITPAQEIWIAAEGPNNTLTATLRTPSGTWETPYEGPVGAPPSNTTPPTVSVPAPGKQPVVGQAVSASTGSWSATEPVSYAYQWNACAGSSCSAISGATSASYSPTAAYVGDTLTVTVTASNAYGHSNSTSAKTLSILSISASVASAPSVVFAHGAVEIATQGLTNALFVTSINYSEGGIWSSLLLGANSGTAYSSPSSAVDSGGNIWVAFEGPEHSLWVALDWANGSPSGIVYEGAAGTTYSAPSAAIDAKGNLLIAAQGPNHDLVVTKRVASSGAWESVTASGTETVYSAPAGALDSGGNFWIAYEGPKPALWEALDWATGSGAGVNNQGSDRDDVLRADLRDRFHRQRVGRGAGSQP